MIKLRRFTLLETVIVLAVISILCSLMVPALTRARIETIKSLCQSNLRQVGMATTLYVYGNDKYFPLQTATGYRYALGNATKDADYLSRKLNTFYDTSKLAECPADKGNALQNVSNCYDAWGSSYTTPWNKDIYAILFTSSITRSRNIDFFEKPEAKLIAGDHSYWSNRVWDDPRSQWHWKGDLRRTNVLFLDMHVELFTFPVEYNSFSIDEPPNEDRWGFY